MLIENFCLFVCFIFQVQESANLFGRKTFPYILWGGEAYGNLDIHIKQGNFTKTKTIYLMESHDNSTFTVAGSSGCEIKLWPEHEVRQQPAVRPWANFALSHAL